MATKKSEASDADRGVDRVSDPRGAYSAIEERRKRREEATTVDGSESAQSEPYEPPEPVSS